MEKKEKKGFRLTRKLLEQMKLYNEQHPRTPREIMETEQEDLWSQATECVKKLSEIQTRIVELLPEYRKQLPSSFKEMEDSHAQYALANHIRLRSLYSLSETLCHLIEKRCEDLAKHSDHYDSEERETEEALQATIDASTEFPFDSIIDDKDSGLLRINDFRKNVFEERLDFGVYYPNCRFSDIIGVIIGRGLLDEWLWKSVDESQDPESSNIKELLDDDKMVRVY